MCIKLLHGRLNVLSAAYFLFWPTASAIMIPPCILISILPAGQTALLGGVGTERRKAVSGVGIVAP
jgi:hypothetical protein